MKSFIIKCILYSIPVIGLHLWVAQYADGIIDAYYLRFTTPTKSNMILGSSKAAQGLRPEFIDEILDKDADSGFFNYAFTLNHSPYGSIYRESVRKKLDPTTKDGTFILEVDSWNLSGQAEDPEDSTLFKEINGEVGTTHFVNMNPNYEYLLDNYPHGWFKLAWKKWKPSPSIHELHADGWLEIDLPMNSKDVKERTEKKLEAYKKNPGFFAPSQLRRTELGKMIDMLKQHGNVYLVRLPVSKPIAEIESTYMPGFEAMMDSVSQAHEVPFFDMRSLPDTFRYVDGNHLYSESGKTVSRMVAEFVSSTDQR